MNTVEIVKAYDKVSEFIFAIYEPIILDTLRESNELILKYTGNNNKWRFIVAGGAAVQKIVPGFSEIRTTDYDIKLAPFNNDEISTLVNTKFSVTIESAKYLLHLKQIFCGLLIDKLRQVNLNNVVNVYAKTLGISSIEIGKFKLDEIHDQLHSIIYSMYIPGAKYIINENLVDIHIDLPVTIGEISWKRYSSIPQDRILKKIATQLTTIPCFVYKEHIYYASIGFVLWDTLRMIEEYKEDISINNAQSHPDSKLGNFYSRKLERYNYKLSAIITALHDPDNFLSCSMLSKTFVRKCNTIGECDISDEVLNKVLSSIQYPYNVRGMFGKDYECEFAKSISNFFGKDSE